MAKGKKRPRRVVRRVVYPRHTALIGTAPAYSAPLDVREFSDAIFVAWRGTGIGSPAASVQFTVQQSADLGSWQDSTTISPGAGSEAVAEVAVRWAWMRVKAVVSGSDPGVTCWLLVDLVRREDAAAGEAA